MNISALLNNQQFKGKYYEEDDYIVPEPKEREIIFDYEELAAPEEENKIDTNDFFRDYELFDIKKGDHTDYNYSLYSPDDVEFCDNIKYKSVPYDMRYPSQFIETPEVISTYEKYVSKPVYTVENGYKEHHESFQTRLNEGFTRKDISRIYNAALINKTNDTKIMDYKLAQKGFEIRKAGKEIDETTKIMNSSKIRYGDGTTSFKPELFDFLVHNPDGRDVVVKTNGNSEYVRKDIISAFSEIKQFAVNKNDAEIFIKACQTGGRNKKKLDDELLKVCTEMVENGYSVIETAKIVNKSKLLNNDGTEIFDKRLHEFLLKHPDARNVAVEDCSRGEFVRTDVIKVYDDVYNTCKNNNDTALVINACQTGTRSNKKVKEPLTKLCTDMIKDGESVKEATDKIKAAKLISSDGEVYFSNELFDFLGKYPESRNLVVQRNGREEFFRPDRAEVYPQILEACHNINDVEDVLKACELNTHFEKKIDNNLVGLALDLLNITPEWTKNHDKIMGAVISNRGYSTNYKMYGTQTINEKKFELAKTMSQNGNYSIGSIYSILVLNQKNPELCK